MPEETADEQSRRRMGVYDYNSLHSLLLESFERLFPDVHNVEPAGMIQLMEAEIVHWRRTGRPSVGLDPGEEADSAGERGKR
jgi:hypothetical protein